MCVTMTEVDPQMSNIALKGLFARKGRDPELFGAYDRNGTEREREREGAGSDQAVLSKSALPEDG